MEISDRPVPEISIGQEEIIRREPSVNSRMVFLVAGRMVYRKGHALLIDALKRIPAEFEYECRIVGDGEEFGKIKNEVQAHPILKERVVLIGKIPYMEMNKEYKTADVFIMPSIRETTGTVLLEAMANGLPIITINKFGGAVLLDDGCAWLYEGDTRESYIENLAECIKSCIQDPAAVVQKGAEARSRAERYTWEEKDKFYQEIYRRLIG